MLGNSWHEWPTCTRRACFCIIDFAIGTLDCTRYAFLLACDCALRGHLRVRALVWVRMDAGGPPPHLRPAPRPVPPRKTHTVRTPPLPPPPHPP